MRNTCTRRPLKRLAQENTQALDCRHGFCFHVLHGAGANPARPDNRATDPVAAGVKEAIDLAKAKGETETSPAILEGFSGRKGRGKRCAGRPPYTTRQKVLETLASRQKFDTGGMETNDSPGDHTGLYFADLSIVAWDGKFKRRARKRSDPERFP